MSRPSPGNAPGTGIEVGADPTGRRARVRLQSGQVAPRLLAVDGAGARVALVSTSATLLSGDDVRIEVAVGPGAWLELVDVAAVVAYHGRGGTASWTVRATVAPGGRLRWSGQPLVVSEGADVSRRLQLDVQSGGAAVLRETSVLGRSGERGGSLWSSARISHDGVPLLAEDLDLRDSDRGPRDLPGMLGGHRVLDTLLLVGDRYAPGASHGPDLQGSARFQLPGSGRLARHLGPAVHRSPLAALIDSADLGLPHELVASPTLLDPAELPVLPTPLLTALDGLG